MSRIEAFLPCRLLRLGNPAIHQSFPGQYVDVWVRENQPGKGVVVPHDSLGSGGVPETRPYHRR